jgi:hypothetical protein
MCHRSGVQNSKPMGLSSPHYSAHTHAISIGLAAEAEEVLEPAQEDLAVTDRR